MKKVLLIAIVLLVLNSKSAFAQGTFSCGMQYSSCTVVSNNCDTAAGYKPDYQLCAAFTYDPAKCNTATNKPCIGGEETTPTTPTEKEPTPSPPPYCVPNGGICQDSFGKKIGSCCSGLTCTYKVPNYGYTICEKAETTPEDKEVGENQFGCKLVGYGGQTSCVVNTANSNCLEGYGVDPNFCYKYTTNQSQCEGAVGQCLPEASSLVGNIGELGCTTKGGQQGIETAIGCIPFTDTSAFMGFILKWAIGVGGGIAFILILMAGFQIMTSTGNPERLKAGQELLTSAIAGLILLIFSVFVLRVIGVDILKIF